MPRIVDLGHCRWRFALDDIREDLMPEQAPASAGRLEKRPEDMRRVGPESEVRGGPEAPEAAVPEAGQDD